MTFSSCSFLPGVKIMSFNIRYGTANDGENSWENRKEYVMQVIAEEDPDIIGLQEALRFQIDEIRIRFPQYEETGRARDDGREKGEYSAILYKSDQFILKEGQTFWFSKNPGQIGSMDWGNNIPRICTSAYLEGKRSTYSLNVFNVHLDHASQNSREKSVELLLRKISNLENTAPVVITGDFNAGENNSSIVKIKDYKGKNGKTFKDTFREIHPEMKNVGTFNEFKGVDSNDKIDFIFVSDGTGILDAGIIKKSFEGKYPSDHFPVTAKISL